MAAKAARAERGSPRAGSVLRVRRWLGFSLVELGLRLVRLPDPTLSTDKRV